MANGDEGRSSSWFEVGERMLARCRWRGEVLGVLFSLAHGIIRCCSGAQIKAPAAAMLTLFEVTVMTMTWGL
jgi:hypothetical protein